MSVVGHWNCDVFKTDVFQLDWRLPSNFFVWSTTSLYSRQKHFLCISWATTASSGQTKAITWPAQLTKFHIVGQCTNYLLKRGKLWPNNKKMLLLISYQTISWELLVWYFVINEHQMTNKSLQHVVLLEGEVTLWSSWKNNGKLRTLSSFVECMKQCVNTHLRKHLFVLSLNNKDFMSPVCRILNLMKEDRTVIYYFTLFFFFPEKKNPLLACLHLQ